MTNKILKIEGMTCAACSLAVERVTSKLPGVVSADVNLATESVVVLDKTVTITEGKLKVTDILTIGNGSESENSLLAIAASCEKAANTRWGKPLLKPQRNVSLNCFQSIILHGNRLRYRCGIESADIVLMKGDLRNVATAIELSRRTIVNIK